MRLFILTRIDIVGKMWRKPKSRRWFEFGHVSTRDSKMNNHHVPQNSRIFLICEWNRLILRTNARIPYPTLSTYIQCMFGLQFQYSIYLIPLWFSVVAIVVAVSSHAYQIIIKLYVLYPLTRSHLLCTRWQIPCIRLYMCGLRRQRRKKENKHPNTRYIWAHRNSFRSPRLETES